MKAAIMLADSNGCYPVPASKGGAVSTLVEHLVAQNSKEKQCDLVMITYYDKEAVKLAEKYNNVEFIWIRVPKIIKIIDNVCFWLVRKVFKKRKAVSYKSLFSLLWYILKGTFILKENSYDKLVLENNIPMAVMLKWSGYRGDYYYHFHNIPRVGLNCQKVFAGCNAILCVSQFVADYITSSHSAIGAVSKDKARVLYNCIDTERFAPINDKKQIDKYRDRYGIRADDQVIVFVGRLSEEKGIDKLLEAVQLIDSVNIKVLIVGSYMYNAAVKDAYQEYLHQLAERMADKIIFTGYISQEELPNIYNLADIAVLPSMWDEPAGLTMIEAMSCGCPVITTNSGGIPEYVGDSAIKLNKDKNIVSELKNQIELLLLNENKKNQMISSGRERIGACFTKEKYLLNFIRLISED